MSTNNFFRTDLQQYYNFVQASAIVYPKEIILAVLKEFFSHDSFYHYSVDPWGFSNVTDHTNLPLGADLPTQSPGSTAESNNFLPTRIHIGEMYPYNNLQYSSVLVRNGGGRSVPISINREFGTVQYEDLIYVDGYGNETFVKHPVSFVTAGAWEGSINIDVLSRSLRGRDDLVERINLCFTEVMFDTLYQVGIIVKPISWSSPTETDDRNDKLFRQTVTLDIRNEWERRIPVGNIIENILFSVEFSDIEHNGSIAPNLTIDTEYGLQDMIDKLKI